MRAHVRSIFTVWLFFFEPRHSLAIMCIEEISVFSSSLSFIFHGIFLLFSSCQQLFPMHACTPFCYKHRFQTLIDWNTSKFFPFNQEISIQMEAACYNARGKDGQRKRESEKRNLADKFDKLNWKLHWQPTWMVDKRRNWATHLKGLLAFYRSLNEIFIIQTRLSADLYANIAIG